jgi:hypothetical protein
VQGGQAGATRAGAGFVVELGEDLELLICNMHDAIAVAGGVPLSFIGLSPTSPAIVQVAGINGSGVNKLAS